MDVTGYWITERQWLAFVSSRFGWAWHDVCVRCDFAALSVAVNAPDAVAARSRSAPFAAQLAAQTWALLTRPPVGHRPRGLAFGTADLTCALNGLQLTLDEQSRTALAIAVDRQQVSPEGLERRFASHLVSLSPAVAERARSDLISTIGPCGLARPVIAISAPWTRLEAGLNRGQAEAKRLRSVRLLSELRRATARLADELFGMCVSVDGLAVQQMGLDSSAIRLDVPVVEVGWDPEASIAASKIAPRLWEAALLVTVGLSGGSHGTGLEAGHVQPETVTLYLHIDDGCEPSAMARGNLAATRATVIPVTDDDQAVVAEYERYLRREAPNIRAAWRAAELRLIRYGPLATAFKQRIRKMSPSGMAALAQMAGLHPSAASMLQSPHGLSKIGRDASERAACVLAIDIDKYLHPESPGPLSEAQYDSLIDYMAAARLGPLSTKRLRKEAQRQQAAGVLRFGLVELREWDAFRRELRDKHGLDI